MAYAHNRRVLHRDLKPGNIMLGKYGETLVVDWGLAWPLNRDGGAESVGGSRTSLIQGRQLAQSSGTPAYMAPEQHLGDPDGLDERTDVYLLGGLLYEWGAARWGSHLAFQALVGVGAACTACCWLVVPPLPTQAKGRDGSGLGELVVD